jgi:hypothetical protein
MKFHQTSLFLEQSLLEIGNTFSIPHTRIDHSQMLDTFTDSVILNSIQNIHIYLIETDNLGFITPVTDRQELWHRIQQVNQIFEYYVQNLGYNTQVTVFKGDMYNYNIPADKTQPSRVQTFPSITISDPSPIDLPYAIIVTNGISHYWSNGYLKFQGTSCEQIPPITNLAGLKISSSYHGICNLSRFSKSLRHLYIVDYTKGDIPEYFQVIGVGDTVERLSIGATKYPVIIPEMLSQLQTLEILNTKLLNPILIGGNPKQKNRNQKW